MKQRNAKVVAVGLGNLVVLIASVCLLSFMAGVLVRSLTAFKGNYRRLSVVATTSPRSLGQLLYLTNEALAGQDIAFMNLACMEGLPNASEVSVSESLKTLDDWAKRVTSETDRNFHQFRERPSEFENSEGYFRILTMITVLQQDFGVHYDPKRIEEPNYNDASDLCLTGLFSGKRQGTCVSMPVLYVAIGRRLGYPLKLVTAKGHLFARWESSDGKTRFNIEATNQGLNCFPDEYYRKWPVPISMEEEQQGGYLKSLTPSEELAVFMSARGHCLESVGRLPEAEVALAQAHALAPRSTVYLGFLAGALQREMPNWRRITVNLGDGLDSQTQLEQKGQ